MGPRHLSRGISRAPWPMAACSSCFNGATASEPWNPKRAESAASISTSFNGATASEPWNQALVVLWGPAKEGLQWGHGI